MSYVQSAAERNGSILREAFLMENSVQLVLNAEAEQPRPASFATGSKICLKPNVS